MEVVKTGYHWLVLDGSKTVAIITEDGAANCLYVSTKGPAVSVYTCIEGSETEVSIQKNEQTGTVVIVVQTPWDNVVIDRL